MKIEYGIETQYIDITNIAFDKCYQPKGLLKITGVDQGRNELFGDPVPGVYKHILISDEQSSIKVKFMIGQEIIFYIFEDLENIKIQYGNTYTMIDVTDIVISYCFHHELMVLPANDNLRSLYFGDPIYYIEKHLMINDKDRYNINSEVHIYIPRKLICYDLMFGYLPIHIISLSEAVASLYQTHLNTIPRFVGGNPHDEYDVQLMVMLFVNPTHTVLELGANIGRTSLIIANVLASRSNHLVALECKKSLIPYLTQNMILNNGHYFHIEISALSYQPLVMKGWTTMAKPPSKILDHYSEVATITFEDLEDKYHVIFDTIVVTCEGAFYDVVRDHPEILSKIKLLILENGYGDYETKLSLNRILIEAGFVCRYSKSGGWGPCYDCYYEVWVC